MYLYVSDRGHGVVRSLINHSCAMPEINGIAVGFGGGRLRELCRSRISVTTSTSAWTLDDPPWEPEISYGKVSAPADDNEDDEDEQRIELKRHA